MDQINNLNNDNIKVEAFTNVKRSITVDGENSLFINNQNNDEYTNDVTFKLSAGSKLDLTLFDVNQSIAVENKLQFELERNAQLNIVIVSLNSAKTNSKVIVDLNGEGGDANINVISVANQGVDTTFNVIANNNAPHTQANITQRAVAVNGGSNVFKATGYIAENCHQAVNYQESRVLLLDAAAKGEASPILLINHHDVEAGHAAGVSRVDEEEMYYLMSRGIGRQQAEELMTVAFIRPIVDKINDQELADSIFEKINKKASYENN